MNLESVAQELCRQRGLDWAMLSEQQRDTWRAQADEGLGWMAHFASAHPALFADMEKAGRDSEKRWLSDLDADATVPDPL